MFSPDRQGFYPEGWEETLSVRRKQPVKMFSPDRQGFFPALWVQFVQELGEGERREFAALTNREERVKWMYRHRSPRSRFELLRSMRQEKDPELSKTRREAGNRAFQAGELKQ